MRLQIVATLPILLTASASGQVQLQFKFREGETVYQQVTSVTNFTRMQGTSETNMSVNETIHTEEEVETLHPGGGAWVRVKIRRLQLSVELPAGQGFTYDSSDEDGETPELGGGNILDHLSGAQFRGRRSPNGEMKFLTISTELDDAINRAPKSALVDPQFVIRRAIGQWIPQLPKESVEKGHTWTTNSTKETQFGRLTEEWTNTYAGTNDDGMHLIKYRIATKLVPKSGQAFEMTDMESGGLLVFDNSEGRIVRLRVDFNMKMQATVDGKEVEQTNKQTVTVEQQHSSEE